MKFTWKLVLAMVLGLSCSTIKAQKASQKTNDSESEIDRWSVGINGGATVFFGDIKQYGFLPALKWQNELKYAAGLSLERSFSPVFSLRLNGFGAQVAGSKAIGKGGAIFVSPYPSNVTFESTAFSGDLDIVINFSNLSLAARNKPRHFFFYGFAGAGYMLYKTTLYDIDKTMVISKQSTTGKFSHAMDFPIGLGLKYRLSPHLDLGLEETFHILGTDLFDNTEVLGSSYDKISYSSLSLTYKFGSKADNNEWVNPLDALATDMNSMKAKVDGLSNDTDKDGVADIFDKDNATPVGIKVYGDGTAVDSDGDGVPDSQDADPFTGKGAKVDDKGRELDSDADGVPDSKDVEPNTPEGSLVNFQGRTINVEQTNSSDLNTSGYMPSVYFASGNAAVQYKYFESLAAVAKVMKSNPSVKLVVEGHADSKGSEKLNGKLALKRAQNVVAHLVKVYGIQADRLTAESKGSSEPFAAGQDGINRRVDFVITK